MNGPLMEIELINRFSHSKHIYMGKMEQCKPHTNKIRLPACIRGRWGKLSQGYVVTVSF